MMICDKLSSVSNTLTDLIIFKKAKSFHFHVFHSSSPVIVICFLPFTMSLLENYHYFRLPFSFNDIKTSMVIMCFR